MVQRELAGAYQQTVEFWDYCSWKVGKLRAEEGWELSH